MGAVEEMRQRLFLTGRPGGSIPSIPGYEIMETLGHGGMGIVFKARQSGLNRMVALKMIRAGTLAAPAERLRFLAEAKAAAAIEHPGIVRVFELGTYQGQSFFASELCPNGSLERLLEGKPLKPDRAASLVEQIANAVEAAHRHKIVHRDLKPTNILLDAELQPKVADFGLAKQLEGSSSLTPTGAVLGTPSYMAPEQAQGSKEVGPAADVYALGAILYECLTGRPPFKAPTHIETLHQVMSNEPVAPRQLNPRVPRDLETVCLKCLHKEPGKRYLQAGDLAEDLRRFLAGRPIQARPVRPLERAGKWVRRNPALAMLGLVASLSLLASVTLLFRFNARLQSDVHTAREAEKQARADLARLFTTHRQTVAELANGTLPPSTLYELACMAAVSASTVSRDVARPLPEREKNAEARARQALDLLRRAEKAAYFTDPQNIERLQSSPDLQFLRNRDDFKHFLAALQVSSAPK
jgi:serine/threonine protein kinase